MNSEASSQLDDIRLHPPSPILISNPHLKKNNGKLTLLRLEAPGSSTLFVFSSPPPPVLPVEVLLAPRGSPNWFDSLRPGWWTSLPR